MRIVQVANFYGPRSGGIRTTLHALATGYDAAGHEAVVVVPGTGAAVEQAPWGRRISVPSRLVPGGHGYRVIVDLSHMRRLLDGLEPDRLEVADRTTLRDLGAWARDRDVPSVVWAHERLDKVLGATVLRGRSGAAVAARVADGHNRRTASLFDQVVCTTGFAAEEFDRIGVPTTRVPLGVDLETFHPRHHDPALRADLAAPDDVLVVLCSRLSPEKRPELAFEALDSLVSRGLRCRLVVAGSGPRQHALAARFSHLPVRWLGFVADRALLARVLATADVAIAPGPLETFGLAALEALASGTPVVATRSSALPDVVGASAGAFGDPAGTALADAVMQLLTRPPAQRREAARRRAVALPWSATVSRMLDLHEGAGRTPPSSVPPARLPPPRVAALVGASFARSPGGVTPRAEPGSGPRVVGLGDSITVGVGDLVARGMRPGWAAHVASALHASAFENLARLGARARSVREQQLDAARACRPDVVLLSVAGNDALRGDLDLHEVAGCVHDVVAALGGDGATVVLLRPPTLEHVTLPRRLHGPLHRRLSLVGAEVELAATAAGALCVSLPRADDPAPQRWHVDRIHPGPGGHRWVASAALRALEPHGYARARPVAPLLTTAPTRAAQAGWLACNGVPWALKRSVDLLPALLREAGSARVNDKG